MKKLTTTIATMAMFLLAAPVHATPTTDALIACVSDNTTGKDRKELAQWIFVIMSAHPDMKPLSNVDSETRDEYNKKLARLATKLIAESCKNESSNAFAADGNASFEAAFNTLGKLAMQELMTNPTVSASFASYTKYLDRSKFEAVFSPKK